MKKMKRIALIALAMGCFIGALPTAEACCGGHHGTKGVYCSYHHKRHSKKSACSKCCKRHKTTHRNGKRHH